jgi:transposase-like protein
MADKVRRGRVRSFAVVSTGEVTDMRRRYARGERVVSLAARYGISVSQTGRIVAGQSRKGAVELPQWKRDGFRQANTLLTDEQVVELRRRYAKGGISQRALAREYGICQPHVSHIVAGIERRSA